jgi:hypothetical protein
MTPSLPPLPHVFIDQRFRRAASGGTGEFGGGEADSIPVVDDRFQRAVDLATAKTTATRVAGFAHYSHKHKKGAPSAPQSSHQTSV